MKTRLAATFVDLPMELLTPPSANLARERVPPARVVTPV